MCRIKVGFSPCPNDTFIFDAIVNQKIDLEGLSFEFIIEDVEKLNQFGFEGVCDVTKMSFHAFGYLTDKYLLLNSGSALGNKCGPVLIAKNKIEHPEIVVPKLKIAIPGKFTTATFLLQLAFPKIDYLEEILFSSIEEAVLANEVDAGLIIHESRFTYRDKGLEKIIDLGEYWEKETGMMIPLGGIFAKRDLDNTIIQKVDRVMSRSVSYAMNHPEESTDYIKQYAQEMNDKVILQHLALYVNKYTLDLQLEGRKAIQHLLTVAHKQSIIPEINNSIFINGENG